MIEISGDLSEVKELLKICGPITTIMDLVINGSHYYPLECSVGVEPSYAYHMKQTVSLTLQKFTPKSEEEVAAEESVKKAEEALKAAKATLDKIKENK
ncbi:hypothetical protein D3C85_488160 [compost metagenome]